MNKNLTLWPYLMASFIFFFLYSCRSEDLLNNNEEEYSSKFKVFSNQEKEKIDYGKGFKTLLERYDGINNVQHTAQALKKAWKNSSQMSDEYIEFNIRSQDITTKNKEVYTLFPLIRNYQVSGIIIAVLKNEDTYVEYLRMSPEAENYEKILELFRAQYIKSTLQNKNSTSKASGGPCGFEGAPPCDIDTIIIIVPGGGSGGGGLPPGGGGGPSGGCGPYEDCIHKPDDGGGGGGETTPTNPTNQNPCDKTKTMLASQKNKDIIDDLKKHMEDGSGAGEKGWRDNKTGTPTPTTQNEDHRVNFGDPSTMNGGYHNHTGTGVNIFSATDISTLIEIARYQAIGSTGNAYMVVVAPGGINYVMYFNGTHNEIPVYGSYSEGQLKNWNDQQWEKNLDLVSDSNLSQNEKLEQIFFSTLENMKLKNKIILQRVEDNTKTSTINQNSNGTTSANPCNS